MTEDSQQQCELNKRAVAQVRAWVLATSLGSGVRPQLNTRACHACGAQTSEAALVCHVCGARSEQCAITGALTMTSGCNTAVHMQNELSRCWWKAEEGLFRACLMGHAHAKQAPLLVLKPYTWCFVSAAHGRYAKSLFWRWNSCHASVAGFI